MKKLALGAATALICAVPVLSGAPALAAENRASSLISQLQSCQSRGVELQDGSHNSCVTTEQNFLNTYRSTWHGSRLSTDGQYGHLTITQVRKFQSYARISVDGLVGPQTWGSEIGFIQCPHGC